MRPVCTNIYLVGNRALTMIDTGLQEDRYTQAMFAHLTKLGRRYRVEQAAITHSHPDHRGGLPWVRASIGPRLYAPAKAIAIAEPAVGKGLLAPLQEGDVLEADGVRLEVIDTPGHSEDSVSFWDREDGVLFTGDTILGKGTTVVHDLPAYMGSLEKLLALQPPIICPGHGPILRDGVAAVREYIAHRQQREAQIVEQLRTGSKTAQGLLRAIYPDVDKRLHPLARRNIGQHLTKLQLEGQVQVEGSGARARYFLDGQGRS